MNYESAEISWGSKNGLNLVILVSLVADVIAKLPALLNINTESFYQRNIGFIIFPILATCFIWKNTLSTTKIVFAGVAFLIALIFINLIPADKKSDTLILSCIHLPLSSWAVLGFLFVDDNIGSYPKRPDFL